VTRETARRPNEHHASRSALGAPLMAAWDDRLAWKLFTGRCRYCGAVCRGVTCAAHADLPRLELLPVQRSVGTVDEPAGDEAA
jgi:hypothetical protein